MSNHPVVSMQELEMESVELLPSRETLHCWAKHPGSSHVTVTNYNNNVEQIGLIPINVQGNNIALFGSSASSNF